jgi:hypothetical protein
LVVEGEIILLIIMWAVRDLKGRGLNATLCRVCLSTAVYNIWKQRNGIKHANQLKTEEKIVQRISWEIRTRIVMKNSS